MAIKKTIGTPAAFRDEFVAMGHMGGWTIKGLEALFDYLNDLNEDFDLDVVALNGEWSEYESPRAAFEDFRTVEAPKNNEDAIAWLVSRTTVLFAGGGRIVVESF